MTSSFPYKTTQALNKQSQERLSPYPLSEGDNTFAFDLDNADIPSITITGHGTGKERNHIRSSL
jgi:hypothetical protein